VTSAQRPSVIILGSSLAGLAAAYEVGCRGHSVTLLDHPAWDATLPPSHLDAGLFLHGCEQETRRLLDRLRPGQQQETHRRIPLEFRSSDGHLAAYRPARLPGALQWAVGLLRFTALAWTDRWRLLSFLEQLWEETQELPADLDSRLAKEWLSAIGQSRAACETVWNPLALRLTGNRLDHVSAGVFVEAMSRTFLRRAGDAAVTGIAVTRKRTLFAPLHEAVRRSVIRCQGDVPLMTFEQDRVTGLRLGDGTIIHADWYLVALEPHHCRSLLPERLLTRWAYFAHLAELTSLPEISVRVVGRARAGRPRLLLCGHSPFHEMALMPRKSGDVDFRLTALGHQAMASMDERELGEYSVGELRRLLPNLRSEDVDHIEVARNPAGALSLHPGASRLRPVQRSPIANLVLAGPWTDTGRPAGLESAVISAQRCAAIIAGATV
jgi:hypothetical protein